MSFQPLSGLPQQTNSQGFQPLSVTNPNPPKASTPTKAVSSSSSFTPLHQTQQPNFLQQSGNFLNGIYKGAVGDVGSILNSQPVKNAEKTASNVINGITVKFVKPALKTPVGKAVGNEVSDFYNVTTDNPNYQGPKGTGIGDLIARGIQNPQVAGAEGAVAKGFSKTGAVIGGAVNAGLSYLANKNNNQPTTAGDLFKNAAIGVLLGGAGGHVAEKQIKPKVQDILTSGTHKPEDLVGAVIKNNLENTTQGKKVIQLAHQAQQQGQHIAIDNPVSDFNKNIQDYRSYGGYSAGKSTPNAALRDIEKVADTPQIKEHTQRQVQEAIKTGDLKSNSDGTITLYRGGKPSSQNGLVSASYDKSVAESFAKGGELHGIQVKPEEIKAFIGKQEKEVLIDKSALSPKDVEQPISEVERVRQETNKNLREMGVPESEIPKPQEVNTKNGENLKPVGTGETKQSTLGRKVEAKAIENKLLKDGIDKLPEYQKANMKEQGKLASDYLASNEKEATDVALGRKSAPEGIIPEAIYTAVENKAIADKNISLIASLAKSSRVGEATAMGQRIRALAERNPDSPVKKITDLLNRRIKSVVDRTGKSIEKLREEEISKVQKVQGEQKKPDKHDWSAFISSIQC